MDDKVLNEELKSSARRHSKRLIDKMKEIGDVPAVVQDSIRTEMEYATKDGYRITARHFRNGEFCDEDTGNR